ncbi:MAG: type II toxin-antitoxin system RelE/ParE family toxin [Minwuia sp.]|nr:type II toxin-antitoxin system RelE/ParE family toxin [Minwuia sp.]
MTRVELTADAERDLIDIYLYSVEHFGPAQAKRYSETLNAGIMFVAEHHTVGSDYGFIRANLRRFECVSHAIYYRPVANGIRVLRILHSRMDPGRHLA